MGPSSSWTLSGDSRGRLQGLLPGTAIAFLGLPLAFLLIFFVGPFFLVANASFADRYPGGATLTVGNYVRFLTDPFYLEHLTTTLLFGLSVTVACLLVSYPLAYYMVRYAGRSYRLLVIAVVSPLLVGVVVRTVGWEIILGTDGIVNGFLQLLHLTTSPVKLLFNPFSAGIGMVHVLLPFMVLSIASVLTLVDRSLEEAAESLGANGARVFWRVTFPLSIKGVAAGCAIVFSLAIGAYVTPVMLGGGRMRIMAALIYDKIIGSSQWPMGAAMAMMLLASGLAVLAATPLLPGLLRHGGRGRP